MESEIGLQGGAQYSYRPSFSPAGQMMTWEKIDQSDRIQLSTADRCVCVCVRVCVDTPQFFPPSCRCHFQSAPMQTAVFWHFFFFLKCCCCCCRQLSSAVGGYIVTETWMALALFAALLATMLLSYVLQQHTPNNTSTGQRVIDSNTHTKTHHHVLILSG